MKALRLFITTTILCVAGMAVTVQAQDKRNDDWKQKMMSEKIAFLTNEMQITPEEAQSFWPVYNQIFKDKDEALKNVFKTFRELEEAIENGKSEKEIKRLLAAYLEAEQRQRDTDSQVAEQIGKVLPVEKTARFFIAEEKFRRQQIHRLHGKPDSRGSKPQQ